jgi:hypothetical protein
MIGCSDRSTTRMALIIVTWLKAVVYGDPVVKHKALACQVLSVSGTVSK